MSSRENKNADLLTDGRRLRMQVGADGRFQSAIAKVRYCKNNKWQMDW